MSDHRRSAGSPAVVEHDDMRKLFIQLGAFILAGLLLWGVFAWRDRQLVKTIRAEMGIMKRDTVIAQLDDRRVQRDAAYSGSVRTYTDVRDRTLGANPTNRPAAEIAKAGDAVVTSANQLRAVNDTLRDSLKTQVKEVKKLKAITPPRFSAFALAGYDWLNAQPLGQVGGDIRIAGPLSITGYLEASKGQTEKIDARGVVAAKFTFR